VERLLTAQPVRTPVAVAPLIAPPVDVASTGNPPAPNPPAPNPPTPNLPAPAAARRKPADISENELREVLRACRWELNETAERLGISRASMYNLNERFPWFRVAGDLSEQEIRQGYQDCNGDVARMAEKLEVSEKALRRRVREFNLT
ncbi:MAG TPA: helix-turn-helix domain-containing protein, partial [Polyangium sp.]|nr:helix-turn-helix domain-containing protein [Polyangium sp.]